MLEIEIGVGVHQFLRSPVADIHGVADHILGNVAAAGSGPHRLTLAIERAWLNSVACVRSLSGRAHDVSSPHGTYAVKDASRTSAEAYRDQAKRNMGNQPSHDRRPGKVPGPMRLQHFAAGLEVDGSEFTCFQRLQYSVRENV
jgi:hypothetical protein